MIKSKIVNQKSIDKKNELEEFDAQVSRYFRRNFAVNVGDVALYSFALSFTPLLTVLPAFVSEFTSSNVIIGMIPAISVLGWMLPQVLSARYVERLRRKKKFILIVGIGERLPWLLIALAALLLAGASPAWNLIGFFVFYALFCFSGGVVMPAWLDMIGKIIPERKRGRFFGLSRFIGNGAGIGGALVAGYLLENLGFPGNYASCFVLTSIFIFISLGCFALTKEPAYPIIKEPSTLRNYLGKLVIITRNNRNYFFFLIATVVLGLGGMSAGFFTVHAIRKLNLSGGDIGRFTAIFLFSQTVINPLWGYLGDRRGHKLVMEAGAICWILSSLIAAFANSTSIFYIVLAIGGMSHSAAVISRMSIVLEFSPPEERATYVGLTNTVRAPIAAVAPILGGMLGDLYQLPFVFLLTAAIVFIALLILLLGVKEPRVHRMVE